MTRATNSFELDKKRVVGVYSGSVSGDEMKGKKGDLRKSRVKAREKLGFSHGNCGAEE